VLRRLSSAVPVVLACAVLVAPVAAGSAASRGQRSVTCTVVGTAGAETLKGTSGNDVVCGKGGDDTLEAVGGNDVVFGGRGNDTLDGGYGDDVMHGGPGGDTFVDFHGRDKLLGDAGDDVCMNGRDGGGGDYLDGGLGSDGYNTDNGDTRVHFEYTVDPSVCNGWSPHGHH
jgi:RTX calcium-binding nonapeptide repeat (4 copies)